MLKFRYLFRTIMIVSPLTLDGAKVEPVKFICTTSSYKADVQDLSRKHILLLDCYLRLYTPSFIKEQIFRLLDTFTAQHCTKPALRWTPDHSKCL